jgi:3-methyladenine DNA glycosylase/8-oxoguanine DNA glycosylase
MIRLSFTPPYYWAAIAGFLASRAIPGVEWVDDAGHYRRVITIAGSQGTICVAPAINDAALALSIAGIDADHHAAISTRVARIFDLAADPRAIAADLSLDPVLGPLVAARPGLRVPGAWDGFELAIRAILGQQISVVAATRLAGKLVARFGTPLADTAIPGLSHAFPSPEVVAAADLTVLGMPTSRARALSALAAAALGDPDLFALGQPLEIALARLKAVKGIGDWTAHYIAMRALRQPDAFPTADIGLMRALADSQGTRPSPAELLSRAEAWRPWRAYAALHLWMSEGIPSPLRYSAPSSRHRPG